MFALSFIAFFLLAVVVTLVYARRLYRLVEYSNSNRVSIFGNQYTSSFTLLADFYFLVELAKGSKVESEPDDELRSRLVAIRKLFLLQLLFGAMMIISFNLNAFLR